MTNTSIKASGFPFDLRIGVPVGDKGESHQLHGRCPRCGVVRAVRHRDLNRICSDCKTVLSPPLHPKCSGIAGVSPVLCDECFDILNTLPAYLLAAWD